MANNYAREKLYLALSCLVGSARIQKRLEAAANGMVALNENDFAGEEITKFRAIREALTRIKDDQLGSFAATTAALSDEEAAEIAGNILSLYIETKGGI